MNAQNPAPAADFIDALEPFLIYNWNEQAQTFEPLAGFNFPPFKPQAEAFMNLYVEHPKRESKHTIHETVEFIRDTLNFYHIQDLRHLKLENMHPRDRVQLILNVQALTCAVMVWCEVGPERQRWLQSAHHILGIH